MLTSMLTSKRACGKLADRQRSAVMDQVLGENCPLVGLCDTTTDDRARDHDRRKPVVLRTDMQYALSVSLALTESTRPDQS